MLGGGDYTNANSNISIINPILSEENRSDISNSYEKRGYMRKLHS